LIGFWFHRIQKPFTKSFCFLYVTYLRMMTKISNWYIFHLLLLVRCNYPTGFYHPISEMFAIIIT
jgi:hypothetical protein